MAQTKSLPAKAKISAGAASINVQRKAQRFNRADWLNIGLRTLAQAGPSALTIDKLCTAARRTKGSFYHHFADHDAFLIALVDRWQIAVLADLDATSQRFSIEQLASHLDHRQERAIRQLAVTQPDVSAKLTEVDELRVSYLETNHRETPNFSDTQAKQLALLEYAMLVGLQEFWPEGETFDFAAAKALYQKLNTLAATEPAATA